MKKLLRRIKLAIHGWGLSCHDCGTTVRLKTRNFGRTLMLDERAHGWVCCQRKWYCPSCSGSEEEP